MDNIEMEKTEKVKSKKKEKSEKKGFPDLRLNFKNILNLFNQTGKLYCLQLLL